MESGSEKKKPWPYCIVFLVICAILVVMYVVLSFQLEYEFNLNHIIEAVKNKTRTLGGDKIHDEANDPIIDIEAGKANVPIVMTKGKAKVSIFIGVMSAPKHIQRRNALRKTWFTCCKRTGVPCWFFTDTQDMHGKRLSEEVIVPLTQEKELHGDLILTESPGGINFARRYLWMAQWANERYNFQYFLRVDDDYFVCVDRLVKELPHRQKEKLYWGHVHCQPKGGIRVDEGFVIVSNDLAQRFLQEQNTSLMCHPYGDQAMAMWINNIPGVTYFGDSRVYHGISAKVPRLRENTDLYQDYISLHGSYPVQVEVFWNHHVTAGPHPGGKYSIPDVSYPCGDQDRTYRPSSFGGMYHGDPKPCKDSPTWQIAPFYRGRG